MTGVNLSSNNDNNNRSNKDNDDDDEENSTQHINWFDPDCQGCPGYYKDFAGSGVSVKIIIRSSDMISYDDDEQVWL